MRHEAIFLLVLSIGLAAAGPTGYELVNKLSELCRGVKVNLKTVDELEDLVKQAESDGSAECRPLVVDALKEMRAITDDKKACTMKKAQAITGFVDKFLKKPSEEIPRALADFAVAYGMQVSDVCTRAFIEDFSPVVDGRIHERLSVGEYNEFKEFQTQLVEKSPVGVVLAPIIKTGEVILPADLVQLMPEFGPDNFELQLSDSKVQARLFGLCDRFLRPLYEPILLPLAHLIRAGFRNKASFRRKQMKADGRFWSTAVFLCESLKVIDITQSDHGKPAVDIAEALQGIDDGLAAIKDDEESAQQAAEAPARGYENDHEVDDLVVSPSVRSLVKAFDANKDELERLRKRILSRSLRVIRVMFRKGKYAPAFKEILQMIKLKHGAESDEFEEAKKVLVELVESPEDDSSLFKAIESAKSVVSSRDARVHDQKSTSRPPNRLRRFGVFVRKVLGSVIVHAISFVFTVLYFICILLTFGKFDWQIQKFFMNIERKLWNVVEGKSY